MIVKKLHKLQQISLLPKPLVAKVFELLAQRWPQAKCELVFNTPFQLLLAVMLSAQTTDIAVNKALGIVFKDNPNFDAQDLLEMGELKFYEKIKTIGLAPTKTKNSLKMAQMIVEHFSGKVPLIREDLETLPGVGRKTANVVLNVLCNLPTMAVDTHVARLAYRIGIVEESVNRVKIETQLLEKVPKKHSVRAHHFLIFHGRYLCTARRPKCEDCCLNQICLKKFV